MIRVKICGLTRRQDAEAAISAGADMLGFIFVPGTPRYVDPAIAGWVRELSGALRVGVFRDATLAEIEAVRDRLELDWVQLHGNEPDSFLEALGSRVLRRVATAGGVDWQRIEHLSERCLPLIDPGAGDGASCDWRRIAEDRRDVAFGLAGGLTPANVAQAVDELRPALVDVASGVESTPGVKEHAALAAFVVAVRAREDDRTCRSRGGQSPGKMRQGSAS